VHRRRVTRGRLNSTADHRRWPTGRSGADDHPAQYPIASLVLVLLDALVVYGLVIYGDREDAS
jgi:hypothetical protein